MALPMPVPPPVTSACLKEVMTMPHLRSQAAPTPPSGLPAISPARGEIDRHRGVRQSRPHQEERQSGGRLISPLEREMAGRPEGGARTSKPCPLHLPRHLFGAAFGQAVELV